MIPVAAAALAAAALLSAPVTGALVVRDFRSGRPLAAFDARPGDRVEIGYTHSVNKGAVIDRFRIDRDGALIIESSVFQSFGAGMSDGFDPAGRMRLTGEGIELSGISRRLGTFGLAVGTVANHWLAVGGTKVALAEIAKPGSFVNIEFRRIALPRAILERMRHERH